MKHLKDITDYRRDDLDIQVRYIHAEEKREREKTPPRFFEGLNEWCYTWFCPYIHGHPYEEIEVEAGTREEALEMVYRIIDEVIPELARRGQLWDFDWPSYVRDVDELLEVVGC